MMNMKKKIDSRMMNRASVGGKIIKVAIEHKNEN